LKKPHDRPDGGGQKRASCHESKESVEKAFLVRKRGGAGEKLLIEKDDRIVDKLRLIQTPGESRLQTSCGSAA